jgi:hypothetical protein
MVGTDSGYTIMEVRLVQFLKASLPIEDTELPMVSTPVNEEQ